MADQYEPLGPIGTDPPPKPAAVQQSTPAFSKTPQNSGAPRLTVLTESPGSKLATVNNDQKSAFANSQMTQDTVFGGQSSYGQTGGQGKTIDGDADANQVDNGDQTPAQKKLITASLTAFWIFALIGSLGCLALKMRWHQ